MNLKPIDEVTSQIRWAAIAMAAEDISLAEFDDLVRRLLKPLIKKDQPDLPQ